jgi:hypothetical protein
MDYRGISLDTRLYVKLRQVLAYTRSLLPLY